MQDHANLSLGVPPSQAGFGGLIGQSAPMQLLYELIGKVSQSTSPVLIIGETGTGKELVARAIHFKGLRREKAFVPVDCSALTPTLVESELFGPVKGAFTGAARATRGLLRTANDGPIFLDETAAVRQLSQATW